jgi:hypothetical protein
MRGIGTAERHVRNATSFRSGDPLAELSRAFRFAAVDDGNNILDVWSLRWARTNLSATHVSESSPQIDG